MGNENSTPTTPKSLRISNLTAVTASDSTSFKKNKEDVTLIWLDKTIDSSRTALREITNYVLLYTEIEPCIAYIRSINTERIFLILSGSYAEQSLNQIHDLPQVDSIFIFCINLTKYKNQFLHSEQYPKIVDVFDNEHRLVESMREVLSDLQKQLATFTLYKNQKSTRDLSSESASFLWFQLFKDILLQMPRSEQAKKEMIEQCQQYYRGNSEELRIINEFEQTYTKSDTIRWYTKQCFIYRLVNKALRTEDIELLYTFRYYIQDLCKRLAIEYEEYKNQQVNTEPIMTFYRGLKLTKEELDRYQSNLGSLISTNGFLSTSQNYDLALQFAVKKSKRTADVIPTLFIIEADTRIEHVVFADISSLSFYPDEKEILFDIGSAFKITEVYFDDTKDVWIVKMKLTNEAREIVETYIEANRREMEKGNIFLIFGLLLTEMGQYDGARMYFENLLSSNTIDDKISIYTNTGRVKYLKGLYDDALKDFKIVYNLQLQQSSKNEIDLARTMNNLGLIYIEQKKYDLAYDYLFDVLKIYNKHSDIDQLLLANTNNVMGIIFTHKQDYQSALKHLSRAMELYETHLPTIDHPSMATNYNSISLIYYYIKEYHQALDYCLKGFRIREKVLPMNHPNIADSCNNLALIYQKLQEYEKAFDLFQRSLTIYENYSDKKINIPSCLNNLGLLYVDQKNYDQAIEYYFKALNYYHDNNLMKYQDEISCVLENLGTAYDLKGEDEQALKYYQQSLESQKSDDNKLIQISMKIGNLYQKKGEYQLALDCYLKGLDKSKTSPSDVQSSLLMAIGIVCHQMNKYEYALDYYQRTLSILQQNSSKNQLDLAWIYNNIGCLYTDTGDLNRALEYQIKAYEIRKISLSETHPDIATSLTNIGRIHQTLAQYTNGNPNQLQRALESYQNALQIRQQSLSLDHPDLAISYYNLALIHFDRQEFQQAYNEVQKALETQKKIFSSNHAQLQQTLKLEIQIKLMLDYHRVR